jgi:hypothetical protein
MTATVLGDFAVQSDPYNRELLPLQVWKTTITMAAATGTFSPSSTCAGTAVAAWIDPGTLTAGAVIKGYSSVDAMATPDYFLYYTVPTTAIETHQALAKRTLLFGTVVIEVTGATAADSFVLYVFVDPSATALALDATDFTRTAPTMTSYAPTSTAYMKVTPNANNLDMMVSPIVVTENLVVASTIVHKIADANGIAATNPATNDTTELYALADEIVDDMIVHIASTVYHVTATGTITHVAATTEATAITEVNLARTNMLSHFLSATAHGSMADTVNYNLVAATAACTTKAEAVTLVNLLATYWLAHCAVTDLSNYIVIGPSVMPFHWRSLIPFFCKTNVSGHLFTTAELRSA